MRDRRQPSIHKNLNWLGQILAFANRGECLIEGVAQRDCCFWVAANMCGMDQLHFDRSTLDLSTWAMAGQRLGI
jgi:hypothetical protein